MRKQIIFLALAILIAGAVFLPNNTAYAQNDYDLSFEIYYDSNVWSYRLSDNVSSLTAE